MAESQPGRAGGIRALVVDDEAPTRAEMAWLLERDPRVAEVRTADNGAEALRALDQAEVDVVFCDIRMPGLDGMEVARILARFAEPPQVVFVTAYEGHAVDAFELEATDYVVKPVRPERVAEAVRKVVAARSLPGPTPRAPVSPDPVEDERIPVELGGVTSFVRRSDVLYVQAHGDYARLHTADGSHLVRVSLTTLEERWAAAGFARIHRSTLVALPAVTQVRSEAGKSCVVVRGGTELQVSRRHARELRTSLMGLPRQGPA